MTNTCIVTEPTTLYVLLLDYCSLILVNCDTLRLGVKGSGSLMLRGNADSMRFLIWIQFGGMTSQNEKW